jgi:hypothetical protein
MLVYYMPHHAEGRVDPVDLALKNRNCKIRKYQFENVIFTS